MACSKKCFRGCLDKKIWFMAVKGLFGLFRNGLCPFLWFVCGRLCELVRDCLWNVQKIVFRGYLDEEKNPAC